VHGGTARDLLGGECRAAEILAGGHTATIADVPKETGLDCKPVGPRHPTMRNRRRNRRFCPRLDPLEARRPLSGGVKGTLELGVIKPWVVDGKSHELWEVPQGRPPLQYPPRGQPGIQGAKPRW
jgi:hypothetical protein